MLNNRLSGVTGYCSRVRQSAIMVFCFWLGRGVGPLRLGIAHWDLAVCNYSTRF